MKLSISNIAWNSNEDSAVYQLMNRYGFKGLEIAPTRLFQNPYEQKFDIIKKTLEIIHENDVEIIAMQSLHFGKDNISLFKSKKERQRLFEYTKKSIVFARNLGVKSLVFGSPKLRNINDINLDYKVAIDFFKELGEYAFMNNTNICIEANPKEYGTNFINTTKDALQLVKDVNSDGFKLHIDLGTIIINNEKLDIINDGKDYIQHIHISEPYLSTINVKNKALHMELKDILKEVEYNRWISIEMKKVSEKSNIENASNCLEYISEIFGG